MIEITLHLSKDCPWEIVMRNHPVLKIYKELPENTRQATVPDFFNEQGQYVLGKAYFWQRLFDTDFMASRTTKESWDDDFKGAIQGKRVWVLDK
jgi:hypothetical protein